MILYIADRVNCGKGAAFGSYLIKGAAAGAVKG